MTGNLRRILGALLLITGVAYFAVLGIHVYSAYSIVNLFGGSAVVEFTPATLLVVLPGLVAILGGWFLLFERGHRSGE